MCSNYGLPPPPGWHFGAPIGGPRMSPTPRSAKYGATHSGNPCRGGGNVRLRSSSPPVAVGQTLRCARRCDDGARCGCIGGKPRGGVPDLNPALTQYTKVADTKFPVISLTSPSLAPGTSKDINTYRVANFNIGSDNSHVANIWLVAPQAGEYCTVGGYVAEVSGKTVTLASFVPGTNEPDEDGPVEMVVDITNVSGEVKAGSWSTFTGVVEKGDGMLVMNAYSYVDQPTGVEESETQSTVIRGGQGEIVITTAEPLSVSVYTLGGALVVTRSLADSDAIAVTPGLYVVKAGNKVEKVLVK